MTRHIYSVLPLLCQIELNTKGTCTPRLFINFYNIPDYSRMGNPEMSKSLLFSIFSERDVSVKGLSKNKLDDGALRFGSG